MFHQNPGMDIPSNGANPTANPKSKPSNSVRATIHFFLGNWLIYDTSLKQILCHCPHKEDSDIIASLINRDRTKSGLSSL
jgi:hypothetical protein